MVINVMGLALGVMVSLMIFLYVFGEFSFDKFNTNYSRIYRIEVEDWALMGPATGDYLFQEVGNMESFVRLDYYHFHNSLMRWNNTETRVDNLVLADSSFFSIFSLEFLEGNPNQALVDPHSLVLTQRMAHFFFGSQSALGKTLRVDNEHDFVVSGVIRDPHNFHIPLDAIIPFHILREYRSANFFKRFGSCNHPTYFLLNPSADKTSVERDINRAMSKVFKGEPVDYRLRPLSELYFCKDIKYEVLCKHGNRNYVSLFVAIAVLILVIAIINFVNLTTARAPLRAREVGIRKVYGGQKGGLIVQFLMESVLLTFLAFSIAIVACIELMPIFNQLLSSDVSSDFISQPLFWLVMITGVLIVGVVAGLYPAFVITSYKAIEVFSPDAKRGVGGSRFRRILIVFQFGVSIFLIIFTLTIYRQLNFLRNRDLGIDKEQVMFLKMNRSMRPQIKVFKERVLSLPHVQSVAVSNSVPGNIRWQEQWPLSSDESVQYTYLPLEPEYISMLKMKFVEGANFSQDKVSLRENGVILNETAVKAFGLKYPVVKSYMLPGHKNEIRVVGVVKDFHFNALHNPIAPLVMSWREEFCSCVSIKITGRQMGSTLLQIKALWEDMNPQFPFEYQFLDDSFNALYHKEERFGHLFVAFSLLAIFIATMGLLGLSSFTTRQRRKEIAVRKVLGASESIILSLMIGEFSRWVLVAGLLSLPVAWWSIDNWLSRFAYHISQEIWIFVFGVLICMIVAVLTVSYHTYKAVNLNPVDAIKYE